MREILARAGDVIDIGKRGEHQATCILFDISGWKKTFGDGTVHLLHQRNGDRTPYPCVVSVDGNIVRWVVERADVEIAGRGKLELQYFVGDAIAKSETYSTKTMAALDHAGEVPDAPATSWVENVLKTANDVAESASEALISERNAEVWAEGGTIQAHKGDMAMQEEIPGSRGYANRAAESAANASNSAFEASKSANQAKEWAVKAQETVENPPIATAETLGSIKVGEGLYVDEDGVVSALSTGGGGYYAPSSGSLNDLNVLCLGDSITYGKGLTTATRWANILAGKFNWKLTVKAKGGIPLSSYYYTVNKVTDESICKYAEVLATMSTKPDIVIVWGGHNDVDYRNSPLGSFDDLATMDTSGVLDTYADKNTIKGALRYIAELVHHYAPKATLYVLTHEWIFLTPERLKVPQGTTDNSRMIDEAVYEGARYYGWIPINTQLSGITPFTKDIYTSDGIHPNAAGTTMIVNFLANELGKHYIIKSAEIVSVSGVTLNKTTATIEAGATDQLVANITPSNATNKNLSWRSSNKEVLIVDNGWVGALRDGNARVTVTTEDGGFTATCDYTVKGTTPDPEPELQDYWALEKVNNVSHDDIVMTSYIGSQYFVYDSPAWLNILQGRTINGIWYKYNKTATGTVDIYLVDLANPTPTNWVKHHTETVAGVAGRAEEFAFADLEIPEGYTIGVKAASFVASSDDSIMEHYAVHYYANESSATAGEYVATIYDFKIKDDGTVPTQEDYWVVENAFGVDHDDIVMTSYIGSQYFVFDSAEWLDALQGNTINGIWYKYAKTTTGSVDIYLVDLSNPAPNNWVKHHTEEVAGVEGRSEELSFADLRVPEGYTIGVKAGSFVASAKGDDIAHYVAHYYSSASATTSGEYVATIYDFKIKGNNSPEPQDYWAVEKAYDIDHDDIEMTSFISNQYFVYDSPEWLNILQGHTINGIWYKYNQNATGTVNVYLVDLANPTPNNWVMHYTETVTGNAGEAAELAFADLEIPEGYTVGVKAFKYVASAKGDDVEHYAVHYYADAGSATSAEYVATIYDFKIKGEEEA